MSNDWLSKRRDAEALEHQSFDACYTADCPHETGSQCYQAQFKSGFDAALEALREVPVEFDENQAIKQAFVFNAQTPAYIFNVNLAVDMARWQFEKDRERIALAERSLVDEKAADIEKLALETRIAELEAALEFYADRAIYERLSKFPGDNELVECSDVACQALGRKAGESNGTD